MKMDMHRLFDGLQVNEAIETNCVVSSDRVTLLVHQKIEETKPTKAAKWFKSKKPVILVAALITLLLASVVVSAATGGWPFNAGFYTGENKAIVAQEQIGVMTGESLPTSEQAAPTINGKQIIEEKYLDAFFFSSITNLAAEPTKAGYLLPEFVFSNGQAVILTKPGETGWTLNTGDTLTISFRQNLEATPFRENGGTFVIGYVCDGVPTEIVVDNSMDFSYTLTADASGEYFFYIQNTSSDQIVISDSLIW